MRTRPQYLTGQKIHALIFTLAAIALVPAAHYARIRLVFSNETLGLFLSWIGLSILTAAALYQVGVPGAWHPFFRKTTRFIPTLVLGLVLAWQFGPSHGFWLALLILCIMEFSFRKVGWRRAGDALLLWIYLAASIRMAFAYSSIIVTLRPCTEYDEALSRIDSHLMFGWTVAQFSSWGAPLFSWASLIYYSIFGILGAGIIFLCLAGERNTAARLSGAILVAYSISLAVFYFFPAQGPFLFSPLPMHTLTATLQSTSLASARALYHHSGWMDSQSSYYVAFPSLHMAQPLIVAWYLRRWRRVLGILSVYCGLLVPSILILRWHYLVDILGGILVAIVAVAIVSIGSTEKVPQTLGSQPQNEHALVHG